MTILEYKGNWNEVKRKLKERFYSLTDNDMLIIEGNHNEILNRIGIKIGKNKAQLQEIIKGLY